MKSSETSPRRWDAPRPQKHLASVGAALLSALLLVTVSSPSAAEESPRVRAEATLKSLSALPNEQSVLAPLLARAKKALERADSARRGGDSAHGSELEALALELTETASDLVRTHAAETQAAAAEQKALDLETSVVRARALVEQAAARRGRASERLRAVEAEKGKPPSAAVKEKRVPAATSPATAKAPAKALIPASKP